jgi:hypothetical protein
LRKEAERQIKCCLAYLNAQSRWASCPHIVRKKVEEGKPLPELLKQFCMTTDLKKVNDKTDDTIWPMPNLEVVMQSLKGSTVFASFDLVDGYWQFPLHEDSQEILSYFTELGILTPTRVIQGAKGAVPYFQSSMSLILGNLQQTCFLLWLDDLLAYAKTEEELLEALRKFFAKCREYGLKLSAKKCRLFQRKIVWCGKLISEKGV